MTIDLYYNYKKEYSCLVPTPLGFEVKHFLQWKTLNKESLSSLLHMHIHVESFAVLYSLGKRLTSNFNGVCVAYL